MDSARKRYSPPVHPREIKGRSDLESRSLSFSLLREVACMFDPRSVSGLTTR